MNKLSRVMIEFEVQARVEIRHKGLKECSIIIPDIHMQNRVPWTESLLGRHPRFASSTIYWTPLVSSKIKNTRINVDWIYFPR